MIKIFFWFYQFLSFICGIKVELPYFVGFYNLEENNYNYKQSNFDFNETWRNSTALKRKEFALFRSSPIAFYKM